MDLSFKQSASKLSPAESNATETSSRQGTLYIFQNNLMKLKTSQKWLVTWNQPIAKWSPTRHPDFPLFLQLSPHTESRKHTSGTLHIVTSPFNSVPPSQWRVSTQATRQLMAAAISTILGIPGRSRRLLTLITLCKLLIPCVWNASWYLSGL